MASNPGCLGCAHGTPSGPRATTCACRREATLADMGFPRARLGLRGAATARGLLVRTRPEAPRRSADAVAVVQRDEAHGLRGVVLDLHPQAADGRLQPAVVLQRVVLADAPDGDHQRLLA